jgi:ABC-type lipoprotein release transport system permease subunit
VSRTIAADAYGISVLDPSTLASVSVGLAMLAIAAAVVPVRRASHVDPAMTLRAE